jgi:hypothetical protein
VIWITKLTTFIKLAISRGKPRAAHVARHFSKIVGKAEKRDLACLTLSAAKAETLSRTKAPLLHHPRQDDPVTRG